MIASEMQIGKKYKASNGLLYRAIERRNDYFLVCKNKTKEYYRMPYDAQVQIVFKGQDRIPKDRLQECIEYIKANYWYEEKKDYITFLKKGEKYKLNYAAQKVLSRKPVIGIEFEKKYANNYFAYKVSKIINFIEQK